MFAYTEMCENNTENARRSSYIAMYKKGFSFKKHEDKHRNLVLQVSCLNGTSPLND